jgi:hypothetical protein
MFSFEHHSIGEMYGNDKSFISFALNILKLFVTGRNLSAMHAISECIFNMLNRGCHEKIISPCFNNVALTDICKL